MTQGNIKEILEEELLEYGEDKKKTGGSSSVKFKRDCYVTEEISARTQTEKENKGTVPEE